ncbi:MAG: argininosuccinate lyase [Ignavibacteria bacterium]|nr:argininosuccinate lyase [Ignavibacteria bacterium]
MKAWNGRFRTRLDPAALKFSSSLAVDKRLYKEDIEGSIAHVEMLARKGIIPTRDGRKIKRALRGIEREIGKGKFSLDAKMNNRERFVAEDVHMAIEKKLIEKVGEIGGKLHTARSRNDQIALDERLYLRRSISIVCGLILQFQKRILTEAERNIDVIMPGYTHLQHAQPILLAHHLLAYVSMVERDRERFIDCLRRVSRSPLGAGALAGTSFPIDRNMTARKLGFNAVLENSIDAVSDRDVQIEFLSACAMTMMHLSRFAEELILWSSHEWNFVEIGDAFTTGSSIMPQKKNPDIAELIRGKTGRVYGDLMALLTVMKGLPLAYNRDLQEDKEPLFDACDTVTDCLSMFSSMLKTTRFNARRFERMSDFLLATEVADYLVRKGLPFRKAHAIAGTIVRDCLAKNISLEELPLKSYQHYSKLFGKDLRQILNIRSSLLQKKSIGSTSPREVRKLLIRWKKTCDR